MQSSGTSGATHSRLPHTPEPYGHCVRIQRSSKSFIHAAALRSRSASMSCAHLEEAVARGAAVDRLGQRVLARAAGEAAEDGAVGSHRGAEHSPLDVLRPTSGRSSAIPRAFRPC